MSFFQKKCPTQKIVSVFYYFHNIQVPGMTRQHLIFFSTSLACSIYLTGIFACSGRPSATAHARDALTEEIADASVSSSLPAHTNIYNRDSLIAARYRDSLYHDSLRLDLTAELPKFPTLTWEKLDFPKEPCDEWPQHYTAFTSKELDHFSQQHYQLFYLEDHEDNDHAWYRLGKLPSPDGLTCLAVISDFHICGHRKSLYVMIYDTTGKLKNYIRWQFHYQSAYESSGKSHVSVTGAYQFRQTILDYYIMAEDSVEVDSTIVQIQLENDGAVRYDTVFSQHFLR